MKNAKSIIESLLFVYGEPLPLKKIAKILELNKNEVKKAVEDLKNYYKSENRGLRIIEKEEEIQMITDPQNGAYVKKLIQEDFNQELTQAALEAIAIIAYRAPISRAEIEDIRGVDSSFLLRRLLIRGLIERITHPKDHRIYLYKITFNCLKALGLEKTEELPNYEILSRKQ